MVLVDGVAEKASTRTYAHSERRAVYVVGDDDVVEDVIAPEVAHDLRCGRDVVRRGLDVARGVVVAEDDGGDFCRVGFAEEHPEELLGSDGAEGRVLASRVAHRNDLIPPVEPDGDGVFARGEVYANDLHDGVSSIVRVTNRARMKPLDFAHAPRTDERRRAEARDVASKPAGALRRV